MQEEEDDEEAEAEVESESDEFWTDVGQASSQSAKQCTLKRLCIETWPHRPLSLSLSLSLSSALALALFEWNNLACETQSTRRFKAVRGCAAFALLPLLLFISSFFHVNCANIFIVVRTFLWLLSVCSFFFCCHVLLLLFFVFVSNALFFPLGRPLIKPPLLLFVVITLSVCVCVCASLPPLSSLLFPLPAFAFKSRALFAGFGT